MYLQAYVYTRLHVHSYMYFGQAEHTWWTENEILVLLRERHENIYSNILENPD